MTVSQNHTTKYQVQTEELPLLVLPEVICFPGALLPVRITEAPDCSLIHDAQKANGLLVVAHHSEKWETGLSSHNAELNNALSLCRIVSVTEQSTGGVLLLVEGLSRATLIEEITTSKPYRSAQIQVVTDTVPVDSPFGREERKQELWELFQLLFSERDMNRVIQQTISLFFSLSSLCDLLAASLPMPLAKSSTLLAAYDVDTRSDLLIQYLRELLIQRVSPTDTNIFPPAFSGN